MCQHKLRASSCTGGVRRASVRERWRSLAIYLTEVVLARSFSIFERRCVKETQCGTPEGDPLDPGLISAALCKPSRLGPHFVFPHFVQGSPLLLVIDRRIWPQPSTSWQLVSMRVLPRGWFHSILITLLTLCLSSACHCGLCTFSSVNQSHVLVRKHEDIVTKRTYIRV